VIRLSGSEQAAFAGNAIALTPERVWMSTTARQALGPSSLSSLAAAGFTIGDVPMDAIEAAGGSLRCCVGELF
jgi:N-dimethylarginine dimethylaminohydrolase